ncbi:unnamed protein product [Pleuronectes platessa]|uniref:Uncharacterized protein n=1 Tax=Pleuronectes platessa TaxID=8262 RepID=A0A9N7UVS7_PLEPL|nr:unnamed protein product [Pleuronectes platessa]
MKVMRRDVRHKSEGGTGRRRRGERGEEKRSVGGEKNRKEGEREVPPSFLPFSFILLPCSSLRIQTEDTDNPINALALNSWSQSVESAENEDDTLSAGQECHRKKQRRKKDMKK